MYLGDRPGRIMVRARSPQAPEDPERSQDKPKAGYEGGSGAPLIAWQLLQPISTLPSHLPCWAKGGSWHRALGVHPPANLRLRLSGGRAGCCCSRRRHRQVLLPGQVMYTGAEASAEVATAAAAVAAGGEGATKSRRGERESEERERSPDVPSTCQIDHCNGECANNRFPTQPATGIRPHDSGCHRLEYRATEYRCRTTHT